MPAGLGRRSSVGFAGWVRVVGTWGSDAAGWRQLRFSSRSLRARPHGPLDVLPLCLANADPSATQPGFRSNRLLAVCFLYLSARNIRTKGSLRRTRNSPGSLALSPHLFDWKNLALSVGALTLLFAWRYMVRTVIAAVVAMLLIIQFIRQAVGVMVLRRRCFAE